MSFSYLKGPMEPLRFLAPLFFMFLLSGCVTGGTSMQSELNQIKHDQYANKKAISALKNELAALKASGPKASKVSRDSQLIDALRESQTTLYSKIAALQEEVQMAYGSMDEQNHHSNQNLSSIASELDLIKSRLDEADIETTLKNIESRLGKLETGGVSVSKTSTITNDTSGTAQKTSSPEQSYKDAYALYEQKKYSAASKAMDEFIKKYPSHTLAGNAQFWLGEILYINKQYKDAILAYKDVLEKHPDNNKVPASMLKQAYAFIQLGDEKAAKGILNNLIKKHPKSNMANYAKKKLSQL